MLTSASIKPSWVVPGHTVSAAPGVLTSQSAKFCALTFDDGPDEKYTMQIMDILDAQGIDATFFVVGIQAKAHLDQVVALHNSGHEIANHSYSHPDFSKLSSKDRRSELKQLNSLLKPLGIVPKWFRPPYGAYNKSTVNIATNHGLETVLWTLDPKDWATPGVEKIRQRVLSQAKNGEVILLHSTNAQTVAALPGIIEGLRADGFQFVTMSGWRNIITGQDSLHYLQPPQAGPYPIAFARELLTAKNVFLESSKAAQLCLPEQKRRTGLIDNPVAQVLITYSNFADQAGCYQVHSSGSSNRFSAYVSKARIAEPVAGFQQKFTRSVAGVMSQPILYYHKGDGDNANAHNPPEWPRPLPQPEV